MRNIFKNLFQRVQTFSLQLHAVQTTLLEDLTPEMKTYYDMMLIDEAQPNLVHDQFGQTRNIPKNGGKVIEFRKFAPLAKALTPLTEGVTPAGKDMKVTAITAEVAQYGDFILQSDVLEMTAIDNTIVEATKLLGQQAGLTLDTITRNILQAGTYVVYCPKIGVAGAETPVTSRAELDKTCALTVKVIQQVVAKLRAANAPTIGGKYVAIIHPFAAYDLMRDKEWIEAHKYEDSTALFNGEIGTIAGVRFVETSEAKIYGTSGATSDLGVFGTLVMGANAFGTTSIEGGGLETIVKQRGSAGTSDALNQRSSVGWKAMKTAEILIQQYIYRIESCSPAFSQDLAGN